MLQLNYRLLEQAFVLRSVCAIFYINKGDGLIGKNIRKGAGSHHKK